MVVTASTTIIASSILKVLVPEVTVHMIGSKKRFLLLTQIGIFMRANRPPREVALRTALLNERMLQEHLDLAGSGETTQSN